jgi:NAD(P)H-flavin reductase
MSQVVIDSAAADELRSVARWQAEIAVAGRLGLRRAGASCPGDVRGLGSLTGSMTVDHTTDGGLLRLGGGTGIAPIRALVEDVAGRGERRSVEVFHGARTDHDLYDRDGMLLLQESHPWLSVRAVSASRNGLP